MKIIIVANFGPPALSCIRSWGKQGHQVGLALLGEKPIIKPTSKYLHALCYLDSKNLFKSKGINQIKEFAIRFKGSHLFCIDERISCWINESQIELSPYLKICIPPTETLKTILSKATQNDLARECGLDVLPEYLFQTNQKHEIHVAKDHYPLCLRPSDSKGVRPFFKVIIAKSKQELLSILRYYKVDCNSMLIAQPFRNLPNLVLHGSRSVSGQLINFEGFLVERKFEGVSLSLCHISHLDPIFIKKCEKFLIKCNVYGNFHFDFLLDIKQNQYFFLELNLRFGGTTAKVQKCGYDEPTYALDAFNETLLRPSITITPKSVTNKQAILKFIFMALKRELSMLDYPNMSFSANIKYGIISFLRQSDEIFSFSDLSGSLSLYFGNFIEALKRAFR